MKKDQILKHWNSIQANQPLKPCPVPYKHEGSTYAEDGIRITGSQQWIDSVLSRIKDLLKYEGVGTRLQLVYKESVDRQTQQPLDSYNCYIQVHRRGGEGAMLQAFIRGNDCTDEDLDSAADAIIGQGLQAGMTLKEIGSVYGANC